MKAQIPGIPSIVPWPKSLATRLSWAVILIVIAVMVAAGAGLIWIAYNAEQQSAFHLQEKNADYAALLISDYTRYARDELLLFETIEPLDTMTPAGQRDALENLLINKKSLYTQFTLLDTTGAETVKLSRFHTFLPSELGNQATDTAFLAVKNGSTYISPVYISPDSGLLSIRIAVPVLADNGEITHVLAAEVNVVPLWQEVSGIRIGESGYAYLVDENGHFIAYQDPSEVLLHYGEDMQRMPPAAEFMAGVSRDQRQVHEYTGLANEPVIGVFAPIPDTHWAVIAELPTREAYAGVTRMVWYLAGLMVVFVVIAGLLVFIVSRRIIQPIQALTVTAQRMGAGDLDAEVIEVQREDEVGVLARTFSHMQGELKTLYKGMEQQVEELKVAHENLLRKNEELNAAYEELTASQEELQANYEELSKKEAELQFTNTILVTQQETSLNGILVVDGQGKIISYNQRFVDMWGIPADVVTSRSDERALQSVLDKLVRPDEFLAKVTYLYQHTNEKSYDEIPLNGGRTFERYSSPMNGPDGKYYGRVWYFLDITRRKQAEKEITSKTDELRAAYEQLTAIEEELRHNYEELAKSQQALVQSRKKLNLLNTVTFQDIQNAVFSLSGYLQLERENLTQEQQQRFRDKEIRIVQTISESLKFSAHYQNLGIQPPRWQGVLQVFLIGISHVDLMRLSRKLEVGDLEIYADPLLEQVFFTLAENVILHGKTATEIALGYRKTGEDLVLVFEDNGEGIPADMKENIFSRRYEEKKGQGLFLVREILEITGISIRESGEPGKGARFEMTVPKGAWRMGGESG